MSRKAWELSHILGISWGTGNGASHKQSSELKRVEQTESPPSVVFVGCTSAEHCGSRRCNVILARFKIEYVIL